MPVILPVLDDKTKGDILDISRESRFKKTRGSDIMEDHGYRDSCQKRLTRVPVPMVFPEGDRHRKKRTKGSGAVILFI